MAFSHDRLLGSRISMYKRMEPSFFGGVTVGDNDGVGSPTGTRSLVSSFFVPLRQS